MYARATHERTPSVYAALAVARQLATMHEDFGELWAYVDCHAHAGKRGCFLYGNLERHAAGSHPDDSPRSAYLNGCLFARLVALNTPFLDFDGCVFYEGDSRHGEAGGSGREAVYASTRPTPNPLVFTLECNYNSGKRDNILPPRFEGTVDPRCISPERLQRIGASPKRKKAQPPPYGVSTWRDVGQALCLAAIDFIGVNPASRCGQSPEAGCDELRKPLREWLRMHKVCVSGGGAADGGGADDSEGEEAAVDVSEDRETATATAGEAAAPAAAVVMVEPQVVMAQPGAFGELLLVRSAPVVARQVATAPVPRRPAFAPSHRPRHSSFQRALAARTSQPPAYAPNYSASYSASGSSDGLLGREPPIRIPMAGALAGRRRTPAAVQITKATAPAASATPTCTPAAAAPSVLAGMAAASTRTSINRARPASTDAFLADPRIRTLLSNM